jgi:hypothetical protein
MELIGSTVTVPMERTLLFTFAAIQKNQHIYPDSSSCHTLAAESKRDHRPNRFRADGNPFYVDQWTYQ